MSTTSLYLFNPENDLSVAMNMPHYMPPPHALQIANDLAMLPAWYAPVGSAVWVSPPHYVCDWMLHLRQELGVCTELHPNAWVQQYGAQLAQMESWGWSRAVKTRCTKQGIPLLLLPSEENLDRQRALTHRRVSREILEALGECGVSLPHQLPQELYTPSEVQHFVESAPNLLLKAPWSGSGKGLYWGRGIYDTPLERWSNGILKRQGSLVGEFHFDKVVDFAMEFYSDGVGGVNFCGYSLFQTNAKGVYSGNLLASDSEIEQQLFAYHPNGGLQQVKEALQVILSQRISTLYRGYLGVDMMLYRTPQGGDIALHPCIELNLRMNMGMVSRILYDRYISPQSTGRFCIDFVKEPHLLLQQHDQQLQQQPLVVNGGKIVSGYLSLCPITPNTQYRARVEVVEGKGDLYCQSK